MRVLVRIVLCFVLSAGLLSVRAQKITVSGTVTGKVAKAVSEVQFVRDGKMQRLVVKKEDGSFGGEIRIREPQFVEILAGNNRSQFFYLIPNETITLQIDKPTVNESIITISSRKTNQLQRIFESYQLALQEKGINTRSKDWQQLLFSNREPLQYAEEALNRELKKNAALLAGLPGFRRDAAFFMKFFRVYTAIDSLSLTELEKEFESLQQARPRHTSMNIPFFREYLTDLANAYAARTLQKYGLTIDYLKQRYIAQFIAAEAVQKYIADPAIRSYVFAEKLKTELAVNGLKNESFVNFLLEHSEEYVRTQNSERMEKLRANKVPDLNASRKRAFDFLLHDSAGKAYRLDDFRGKVVFVDFWASWCAPCKAQIPHQKELEKAYAGKDVVFLSVSLDKSKPAWLKAVKDEDLHGYVLHAEGDFKNPFPQAYGVEAIPRYLLIDAEGNIISDNMMKPENKKEIMGVFDEELYARNTGDILDKHYRAIGASVLAEKGLTMDFRQTIPGFASLNKTYYSPPSRFRSNIRFESTEQMLLMLGEDFFTEKVAIVDSNRVTTNYPGMADIRNTWETKIFGFELFLRKTRNGAVIKYAAESAAQDSAYVLKLYHQGTLERYYINKKTYLLDKIVIQSAVKPRQGAGVMEVTVSYSDYRPVDGMMVPFKVNQNNIITIKVEQAAAGPVDPKLFSTVSGRGL